MDVLLATIAGVGIRGVLYSLDERFGNATPILIGIWEGLAIHKLSHLRRHSSPDHYLGYAFRSFADMLLFGNLQRVVFIALWTGVSVISAEAINPKPPTRPKHSRHRSSRFTRSRPYEVMERQHRRTGSSPVRIHLAQTEIPTTRPSQPPTPPSFFLEGESETGANSPYVPLPIINEEGDSPSPKPILLPPPSLAPAIEQRDLEAVRHLYTIEEASTEISRDEFAALGAPAPYAPSIATTSIPIPIPNPTTYIHNNANQAHFEEPEDLENSYANSGPPIVVPNPTSQYTLEPEPERPFTPSEPDELRTPGVTPWLLPNDDPLATPRVLSPVFSEQQQLADFNPPSPETVYPLVPPPSAQPTSSLIQVLNSTTTSVTTTITGPEPAPADNKVSSNGDSASVEYLSLAIKAKPSEPPPDVDKLSEAGSLKTETDETVVSVVSAGNSSQLYARAEALRNEAKDVETGRIALQQELDKAKNSGDTRRILFLKEEIRLADIECRKLHDRAVRRFIKARNSERKPQTIDVHGLRVAEAIQTTERALRQAYTKGYPSIKVIVGKGLHSLGGKPVLKQAIQRHMELQLNIPCQVDPSNAGVLICYIPR